jgi:hypothetical protein
MKQLEFFTKIEWAAAEHLTGMKVLPNNICYLPSGITFHQIDTEELVGVKQEETYENNQRIWTLTVTFKTTCKEPSDMRGLAYRVTTQKGQEYIIGTSSRPYPVWKESVAYPEKGTESQLRNVTITLKSRRPLLSVLS